MGNPFSAVINGVEHVAQDMESLVSKATSELESLGIAVTGDIGWLVKFLIEAQEDPVVAINQLRQRIVKMGGEIGSTLGTLASGVMEHGLMGFAQQKVTEALQPLVDGLPQSSKRGQAIADIHRTTLTTMKMKLDGLKTGGNLADIGWQGPSADAMSASFDDISGTINQMIVAFENGGPQDKLNIVCGGALAGIVVVGGIVLICEMIVTIIVAVFGFVTGPGDLVVLGSGGALMAETLEVLETLVLADLIAWLLGSILIYVITHPISITWNPPTSITAPPQPLISSDATLPNPQLTPEGKIMVNDLFNEFGGQLSKKLLEYLIKTLGASKLSAAMIRCLYQSGYLDLSNYSGSNPMLTDANANAWVNIDDHVTPQDLEGAWKDNNPGQVDPTTIKDPRYVSGADHKGEVNDALNAIDRLITNLTNIIKGDNAKITYAPNPGAPTILDLIQKRDHLQSLLDIWKKVRDFIRSRIAPGSPPPNTWPDQGKLPLIEDLLQASTCSVPGSQYYK
ncbi:MAG: hypothetical protein ACRDHZ_01720 [Ktedonobacteraceae bacterium]